ncbi:MAG: transcriptional regulator, LacI family [Acidobacteriaceae bacterium]|nr:transcriptional regulator, LacI family [Acidobacteriaceae bacterium]
MKRSPKPAAPQKLDIRSVAARARVSIATVSRTINHIATVDAVLAARVWKAVEELNYFPNTQARALVSGRSRLLGLIVSEITNPFFPELIQEFENVAVERGYEILISSTNYDPKKTESCVRRMLERKVDGVAIMTFGIEELLLDRFAVSDIPSVFMDLGPKRPSSTTLTVDYKQGIDEGVRHLAKLGHRKIAFISGPLRLRSAQTRKAAFLESLHAHKLTANDAWMIEGDHTLDGGRDAMHRLLALKQWPTAIMCSNDMTAIGVQHVLFEAKLTVPQDFSLIGFDDVHLAEYTIPPLTTVRMSCKDLAQAAVASLLSHLASDDTPHARSSAIPTRLIVRQTTGAPRKKAAAK